MDIPDVKTCKVIKIEFNKQIIDRWDSKIDFRAEILGVEKYYLSMAHKSLRFAIIFE